MDVLMAMGLFLLLIGVAAVAAPTVGGVPERKPPSAPDMTGDFHIGPYF